MDIAHNSSQSFYNSLPATEARYRSLFDSIDEGFCVVEVLFDLNDHPIDYRFLETNPRFEEQTGLLHAKGKTARELLPDLEAHWFEIYGKVALTGEPNRFTQGSSVMNRWFDVYAFRVGEPQRREVAILFRDVTQQKSTEEALRASEEQLRLVANAVPALISYVDAQHCYRFVNRMYEDWFGIPADQITGKHLSEILGKEAYQEVLPAIQKVLSGVRYSFERFLQFKNADEKYVSVDYIPDTHSTGEVRGFYALVQDVTERRYRELNTLFLSSIAQDLTLSAGSEEVMQLLSEKIAQHFNVSRVFFVEIDEVEHLSRVLYDWCEENLPSTVGTYALKDYADEAFLSELKLGRPVVINDFRTHRFTAANAARFEMLKMGAALNAPYLNHGQLKFLLAVQHTAPYSWREDEIALLQELSARIWTQIERNSAEEALRESENRLRLAQEAAGLGIHDFNVRSGTITWDARVRELWGVEPDEIITYDVFSEGVHPDDLVATQAAVERALDPGGNGRYYSEYRVTNKKDGSTRWIVATGQVSFENGQAIRLVGTVQDITGRKELEVMKDTFVRIAGHELRTPLTSLLGNLGLAKRLTPADHPGSGQIQRATESALKMRNMIQDFLDSYRSQHLEMTYEMTVFDFDALVKKAIDNITTAYPKHQVLLQGQTGVRLNGDVIRIEQMINNLLHNAIKYSPEKNRVDVNLECGETHLQLTIKDYGIGISPQEIPRIFNRFHRAENAGKIKGMGLGLYLVKQIIEYHQGTIETDSKPGEGSSFRVKLPFVR